MVEESKGFGGDWLNRKKLISDLKRARTLYAECPSCAGQFRLSESTLIDGLGPMPPDIRTLCDEKLDEYKERMEKLRARRISATEGAEKKAIEVGIGQVVEKVVPNWKAFSFEPPDCRPLFEPIDYVVFDGMTKRQEVESVVFMDIKTGKSRLNKNQRLIRDAVEDGRVRYTGI